MANIQEAVSRFDCLACLLIIVDWHVMSRLKTRVVRSWIDCLVDENIGQMCICVCVLLSGKNKTFSRVFVTENLFERYQSEYLVSASPIEGFVSSV